MLKKTRLVLVRGARARRRRPHLLPSDPLNVLCKHFRGPFPHKASFCVRASETKGASRRFSPARALPFASSGRRSAGENYRAWAGNAAALLAAV